MILGTYLGTSLLQARAAKVWLLPKLLLEGHKRRLTLQGLRLSQPNRLEMAPPNLTRMGRIWWSAALMRLMGNCEGTPELIRLPCHRGKGGGKIAKI